MATSPLPSPPPAMKPPVPAAPKAPAAVTTAPVKVPVTKTNQVPAQHMVPVPQITQTVGTNPDPPAQESRSEPQDTVIPYTAGSPTGFAPYGGWY